MVIRPRSATTPVFYIHAPQLGTCVAVVSKKNAPVIPTCTHTSASESIRYDTDCKYMDDSTRAAICVPLNINEDVTIYTSDPCLRYLVAYADTLPSNDTDTWCTALRVHACAQVKAAKQ